MKKLLTIALSLVLMLALSVCAFAADEVPATEEVGDDYAIMPIMLDEEVPATEEVGDDYSVELITVDGGVAPAVFADVAEDAWYYEAVQFAAAAGFAAADEEGNFNPDAAFTVADVLAVVEKIGAAGELDVAALTEKFVASGTINPEMLLDPTAEITREQVIVVLWYVAQASGADVSVGEDTNILSYEDALEISEYAIPAVQWACGEGILNGYPDGTLRLGNAITRAEIAKVIMVYAA